MRGLTPLERSLLQVCTAAYEPDHSSEPMTADEEAAIEALIQAGRLCIVQVEGGAIYQTTDMGRLALTSAVPNKR